jgi:hypothetical protein
MVNAPVAGRTKSDDVVVVIWAAFSYAARVVRLEIRLARLGNEWSCIAAPLTATVGSTPNVDLQSLLKGARRHWAGPQTPRTQPTSAIRPRENSDPPLAVPTGQGRAPTTKPHPRSLALCDRVER